MTPRASFLKVATVLFVAILVMSIYRFGQPWKLYLWALLGIFLLLAFVPPLGRPLHSLWRNYVARTSQGMRFFQGAAIFAGLIAVYQIRYVESSFAWVWPPVAGPYRWWAGATALALLAGVVRPLADRLFAGWMAIARVIQAVMSRVILTIVYVLAVLPVGLLGRLVGKRFLDKELDRDAPSYWIDRPEQPFDQKRYRRHF